MRSDELDKNAPEIEPLADEADFASLVRELVDPVVIMNREGRICFMNPRAERMLCGGLKNRLEAQLRDQPEQPAISQVRFRRDSGAEIILKIRLAGVKWRGEAATQVSLKDVTAYYTAAQLAAREVQEEAGGSAGRTRSDRSAVEGDDGEPGSRRSAVRSRPRPPPPRAGGAPAVRAAGRGSPPDH
jgi:PAS domain-containing protein